MTRRERTHDAIEHVHARTANRMSDELVYLAPASEFPHPFTCPTCWPSTRWFAAHRAARARAGKDPDAPITNPLTVSLSPVAFLTPDTMVAWECRPHGWIFGDFEGGWERKGHGCGKPMLHGVQLRCEVCRQFSPQFSVSMMTYEPRRFADAIAASGWEWDFGKRQVGRCALHRAPVVQPDVQAVAA